MSDPQPPSPCSHHWDVASQTDTIPPCTGIYTRIPPPYFCNRSDMASQTDDYLHSAALFPIATCRPSPLPVVDSSLPDGLPDSTCSPVVLAPSLARLHSEAFSPEAPGGHNDPTRPCCCCCTKHQLPRLPPHISRYLAMSKRRDVDPVTAGFSPLMGDVPHARSAFLDIGARPEVGLASLGIFPAKPRIPCDWEAAARYWQIPDFGDSDYVGPDLGMRDAERPTQITAKFPKGFHAVTNRSRPITRSAPATPGSRRQGAATPIVCEDCVGSGTENYYSNPISLLQLVASRQLDELAEIVCSRHGHRTTTKDLIHSGPKEGYIFKWECEGLFWTAKVCTNCGFRRLTCSKRLEISYQNLSPAESPKTHLRVLAVWDGIVCQHIIQLYVQGLLQEDWWKNDLDFADWKMEIDYQRRCGTWKPRYLECDHPPFEQTYAKNGDELAEEGQPITVPRHV